MNAIKSGDGKSFVISLWISMFIVAKVWAEKWVVRAIFTMGCENSDEDCRIGL